VLCRCLLLITSLVCGNHNTFVYLNRGKLYDLSCDSWNDALDENIRQKMARMATSAAWGLGKAIVAMINVLCLYIHTICMCVYIHTYIHTYMYTCVHIFVHLSVYSITMFNQ